MALYDVSTSEKKASPELVAGGTLYSDMPIASEVKFDGTDIPSSFLACNGSTFSATTYPELAEALGGTTLPTNSGYIIKAKMTAVPADFMDKVDEVINENATSPISANDKLMVADSLLNYHSIGDNGYDFTAMTTAPLGKRTQFFTNWNDSTNFPAVYGSGIYIPAKDATCATIIYSTSNGNTYIRYRNSGTWTSWKKLVTESDLTPVDISSQVTFGTGISGSVFKSGKIVQVSLATTSVTSSMTWISNMPKATRNGNYTVIGYNTSGSTTADKCGVAGLVTFGSDRTTLVNGHVPNQGYNNYMIEFTYIAE